MLLDEISGTFEKMLGDLKIVAPTAGTGGNTLDVAPGHFYDWLCCTTEVDAGSTETSRKESSSSASVIR